MRKKKELLKVLTRALNLFQAAARLFKGQQQNDREQSEELVWEQFPALGLLKVRASQLSTMRTH